MKSAEATRKFPKVGWRNRVARYFLSLKKRPAPTPFLKYRTKTSLFLPFGGEWYVYWGGRSVGKNRHAIATDQRFAYDFMILKDDSSFVGSGDRNIDYHCFGQPIYAPGDGLVNDAADGIPDNVLGVMNANAPAGNYVILDHGHSEYSFIAHLKQGTVHAKRGQTVRAGELLGECGNSGNSTEPHLHYHLQNTPVLFRGEGLPAQFLEYVADGKRVSRGEPQAGESVRRQVDRGQ